MVNINDRQESASNRKRSKKKEAPNSKRRKKEVVSISKRSKNLSLSNAPHFSDQSSIRQPKVTLARDLSPCLDFEPERQEIYGDGIGADGEVK